MYSLPLTHNHWKRDGSLIKQILLFYDLSMLGITSSIIKKWMKVAIVLFGIFDSVLDVQEVQNKSELYIVSYISFTGNDVFNTDHCRWKWRQKTDCWLLERTNLNYFIDRLKRCTRLGQLHKRDTITTYPITTISMYTPGLNCCPDHIKLLSRRMDERLMTCFITSLYTVFLDVWMEWN